MIGWQLASEAVCLAFHTGIFDFRGFRHAQLSNKNLVNSIVSKKAISYAKNSLTTKKSFILSD